MVEVISASKIINQYNEEVAKKKERHLRYLDICESLVNTLAKFISTEMTVHRHLNPFNKESFIRNLTHFHHNSEYVENVEDLHVDWSFFLYQRKVYLLDYTPDLVFDMNCTSDIHENGDISFNTTLTLKRLDDYEEVVVFEEVFDAPYSGSLEDFEESIENSFSVFDKEKEKQLISDFLGEEFEVTYYNHSVISNQWMEWLEEEGIRMVDSSTSEVTYSAPNGDTFSVFVEKCGSTGRYHIGLSSYLFSGESEPLDVQWSHSFKESSTNTLKEEVLRAFNVILKDFELLKESRIYELSSEYIEFQTRYCCKENTLIFSLLDIKSLKFEDFMGAKMSLIYSGDDKSYKLTLSLTDYTFQRKHFSSKLHSIEELKELLEGLLHGEKLLSCE